MLSTDRQTNKQTNKHYQKHNLLCQGGNNKQQQDDDDDDDNEYDLGLKYYAPQVQPERGYTHYHLIMTVHFMSLRRLL